MKHEKIIVTGAAKMKVLSIILYTDKHPFVKKCLCDNDFWTALSEISGDNWNIYAVKPLQGYYYTPDPTPSELQFCALQCLCRIWKEPADNKPLIELLGLDDTKDLPLIYFFKLSDEGIITDEICIKIEGNTEKEVYNDLEKIISKISTTIKKDNYSFDNIKNTIKIEKVVRVIKRGAKILSDLNSLIPGIK